MTSLFGKTKKEFLDYWPIKVGKQEWDNTIKSIFETETNVVLRWNQLSTWLTGFNIRRELSNFLNVNFGWLTWENAGMLTLIDFNALTLLTSNLIFEDKKEHLVAKDFRTNLEFSEIKKVTKEELFAFIPAYLSKDKWDLAVNNILGKTNESELTWGHIANGLSGWKLKRDLQNFFKNNQIAWLMENNGHYLIKLTEKGFKKLTKGDLVI